MKIIFRTIVLSFLLTISVYAQTDSTYIPPKPKTPPELVAHYAAKYGVSPTAMTKVIQCESIFNIKAVNWQDSHRLSKGSHGIAQFSRETMAYYGKQIGIYETDPYNPDQAIEVMAYMFSTGQARQWSCAKKVGIL